MSLIKWSPFFEPFDPMDKMFENMVAQSRGGLIPAIDVYDKQNAIVIETALPGVLSGDVELAIDGGVLTIRGKSERKTEVDDKNYYRKEIRSGSFMRQVALPPGIDETKALAGFKDGILKIEFPKLEKDQTKTIKIDIPNDEI